MNRDVKHYARIFGLRRGAGQGLGVNNSYNLREVLVLLNRCRLFRVRKGCVSSERGGGDTLRGTVGYSIDWNQP